MSTTVIFGPQPAGLGSEDRKKVGGSLQLIIDAIQAGDYWQLAWRTGLVVNAGNKGKTLPLPILLRIDRAKISTVQPTFLPFFSALQALGVMIVTSWIDELDANAALNCLPGRLLVDAADPSRTFDGVTLPERLSDLLKGGFIKEVSLAGRHTALRTPSTAMGDIGMPVNASYKGKKLTGKDIVIGILDDGCPFAHQDFLLNTGTLTAPVYHSRTARLWDQSTALTPALAARGWKPAGVFTYGREIAAAQIESAINTVPNAITAQGWINEDVVYEYLGYPMDKADTLASHGGRVMGIAAGNGRAAVAVEGVAPEADVVFVQLPPALLDSGGGLSHNIVDGLHYVFNYAAANNKAAVVNLSLGNYSGPHDGSSWVETAMDQLLAIPNRSIVVSAGNGFEADCHVSDTLLANSSLQVEWRLKAEDPTTNDVEIWYDGSNNVDVYLIAPDATSYGPFLLGANAQEFPAQNPFGRAIHKAEPNGDCSVLIWLSYTGTPLPDLPPPPVPGSSAAPGGQWKIQLVNRGAVPIRFHAWIHRDDFVAPGGRRMQSTFDPELADPRNTICDLAGGQLTISVGAHNAATQEVAGYSAAGPTRATGNAPVTNKPDVLAPGEAAPNGRGVLASSSARAQPTRMNGTSAASPHVAGIVALIFQYAKHRGVSLSAAQVRAAIRASASPLGLLPNRHQRVARYPKIKQANIWNDVVGRGKVNLRKALNYLFPPPV